MSRVAIANGDSGLTVRTALNDMFTELYADAAAPYPVVATFADLPAASSHSGEIYLVESSTGIILVNRHPAGLYYSDGASWTWLGDMDMDAATITNTPAGNISSTTVQAAINELDTEKQAASSNLTTFAGITPSSNVQSVLSAADYAAIRTLLGLVIGTNVQAYDADLTTYASITPSANVQSLLGAANYAAMKTLLAIANTDVSGLGTASTKDVATAANIQAGTTNKVVIADTFITAAAPQTLTDQATITWDMHAGFNAKVTLGGNRTLATPTNPHVGLTYALGIIQDGTGSRTLTWPSSTIIDWGSAGAPTLSTGAGKRDLVFLYCYDDSTPSFRATFNKAA